MSIKSSKYKILCYGLSDHSATLILIATTIKGVKYRDKTELQYTKNTM